MNYHVGDSDKIPLSIHVNGVVYAANDVRLLLVEAVIYDRYNPLLIYGKWTTLTRSGYATLPSSNNEYYIPLGGISTQYEDKQLTLQLTVEIADIVHGSTIKRTGELNIGIIKPTV